MRVDLHDQLTRRFPWWLLLLCLVAPAPARAGVALVDGVEIADTAGTSPLCEAGSCAGIWTETLGGGAVTGDLSLCVQATTCQVHQAVNGGAATSKHAVKVDLASGESAYYSLGTAVTLNAAQVASHLAVHLPTAPPSAIRILEHREGANAGCYVRVNTDLTLSVLDGTGNTFGTTAKELEDSYCSGTACSTDQDCLNAGLGDECISSTCHNIRLPCDADGDCPSGQTCGTCTTSTGAGCYWGHLELITTTLGTSRACELAWDGTIVITGAPQTATTANVSNLRAGVISGLSGGGTTLYVDDAVIFASEDRTGMTVVERTCPDDDGDPVTWTRDSCGGAGPHEQCVDDYCTGSFLLGSGFVRRSGTSGEETFDGTEAVTVPIGGTVTGVETQLIGSQSGTNAYALTHRLLLCDGSTCEEVQPSVTVSGTGSTTNRLLARGAFQTTGIAGAQEWTEGRLTQLGAQWVNATGNASTNRVHAHLAYVAAARPDSPTPITLCQDDGDPADIEDHNYGPNDGLCVIAGLGDSTAYGTLAVQCQNSSSQESCNQADYCGWDYVERDKPAGGCAGSDAVCQTCASRQEDFNGGAGLPCGPSNSNISCDQCGSSTDDAVTGGCCASGVCDGVAEIPCAVDADCVLGTCSTCTDGDCTSQTPTDTCELSCPGSGDACTLDSQCSGGEECNTDHDVCAGTCPINRASWPSYLPAVVGADLILQCGQGTETLTDLVQNRLGSIVQTGQTTSAVFGTGPCVAVRGTGECECATGADCGTGGVCTAGRCTAGDATRIACTEKANCATDKSCLFVPPDYVIVHEGYNDFLQYDGGTASCEGPQSLFAQSTGKLCDNCPTLRCTANSGCTSRSADSECAGHVFGFGANGPDYPCNVNRYANLLVPSECLLQSNACRAATDCAMAGQTCSGYSGGDTADGWCDCGADDPNPATNCPSGFSCLNGRCRKACTLDSQCGTDGDCVSNVCAGLCTCPSNSADMSAYPNAAACTIDGDCPNFGICSGGACICGGQPMCFEQGDPCRVPALRYWNSVTSLFKDQAPGGMGHFPYWIRQAFDLAEQPADADGGPLLMFSTLVMSDLEPAACTEGFGSHPAWVYHAYRRQLRGLLDFPHLIDTQQTWWNNPGAGDHVDSVHPGAAGAQLIGQTSVGAFLNSLNVCATDAGTERALAQSYCRTTAGAWQSTICDTLADCSAGQLCERRPCNEASDCPDAGDSCNLESGAL